MLVAVAVIVAAIVGLGRACGVGTGEVTSASLLTSASLIAPAAVRVEIAPLARGTWSVFRDVEAQRAPSDRASMELLNCLLRLFLFGEPNEREASRATRFAVLWNVNINDLADFTEDFAKLFVGRGKVEVPYEYLV